MLRSNLGDVMVQEVIMTKIEVHVGVMLVMMTFHLLKLDAQQHICECDFTLNY